MADGEGPGAQLAPVVDGGYPVLSENPSGSQSPVQPVSWYSVRSLTPLVREPVPSV